MSTDGYHAARFAADPRREQLWKSLYKHYFCHRIPIDSCVIDLGCGYGNFINNVVARRRIAVDAWPEVTKYLAPGVEAIVGDVCELDDLDDGSIDYAFASNLVEHLPRAKFRQLLQVLRRKLSRTGTLTLLQPNYRFAYREYFDDYTHIAVYSHISLRDMLIANDYAITEQRPRFLPLTIQSRWPVLDVLIGLYLASPFKPFAKQMLISARPTE